MGSIVQNQFIKFHGKIRLDMDNIKAVIEKRDMLIDEIRAYIKKMCENDEIELVKFETFNQGSYSMGTGIKPQNEDDDYDIDCGLLFEISIDDYSPIRVKQWVFDALNNNEFRTVEWKKACVRVQYIEEGLPKFHVDFASYSNTNDDDKIFLAKGTPTSTTDNKKWEETQPKKLRDLINDKFDDEEECSQFKRVIRYAKRWKDNQFTSVNGKPTGIALTALAYEGFKPYTKDLFTSEVDINDLKATKDFVGYILSHYNWLTNRISIQLPVPPHNDLFEKMTDQQCKELKQKLEKLRDCLIESEQETDPHEACKILKKQFGDDFPVPVKEETGQNRKKAIAGTSESA
ncbi:hypothetical protein A4D02_34730 [Niastella koreensis]|uniref:Cyclic GMP-AMP synthase n=2 Tax=Niastella koreensis TaxID=354356 RepID=G8T7H8_NIAKG|nr:hypothetical protein [Niastella koreensis]AEW02233.1 hypothetical protein Niako_6007 [Niastella koreensis GR20-10]OQP45107.1 hypothetical protein A4D02_34730 [Niastella koreensis]